MRDDFTLIDDAEATFFASNRPITCVYITTKAPGSSYYFPDMLKAISRAKDELVTPDDYMQMAQQMLAQAQEAEAQQELRRP